MLDLGTKREKEEYQINNRTRKNEKCQIRGKDEYKINSNIERSIHAINRD